METTLHQQAREVMQLHQTIDRMARMLAAHTLRQVEYWLGMKQWPEDTETKWDECNRDNVQWGTGITDMTVKGLATPGVGEAAPTQQAGREGTAETARQGGGDLEASQCAGTMQDGEPEKGQRQQRPKPKPKLPLNQQPEPQHKPKPRSTPTPARRWETIQR